MVRAFDGVELAALGPARRVTPIWTGDFAADVERYVIVNERLVGSGPAGATNGRAAGVGTSAPRRDGPPAELTGTLGSWGMVSALAPLEAGRIAVGRDSHVSAAAIDETGAGVPLWDVAVEFEPAVLVWDGGLVWAAGSEAGAAVDDYDWEARHGGGFAALDPVDGRIVVRGRFHQDLAWGAGGVAVVIVPGFVCGFGRRGEVHLFDIRDGAWVRTTAAISDTSLGIAHGALLGDQLRLRLQSGRVSAVDAPGVGPRRTA